MKDGTERFFSGTGGVFSEFSFPGTADQVEALALDGADNVLMGTDTGMVWRSTDGGGSWAEFNSGAPEGITAVRFGSAGWIVQGHHDYVGWRHRDQHGQRCHVGG